MRFCVAGRSKNTQFDEWEWSEPTGGEALTAAVDDSEAYNLELEQLLYRDMRSSPLLEKTEERQLTQRAHAAWNGLLACLRDHHMLAQCDRPDEKASNTVNERDVIRLIEQLHIRLKKSQQHSAESGSSCPVGHLKQVVNLLKGHLANFRQYRDELVRRNMRLVASVARHYRGQGLTYLDLIQEGTFGLMRAIEKFDPAKEVRFSTYAIWWIWQSMSWAQTQHGGTVIRLPAALQAQRRRLARQIYAGQEPAVSSSDEGLEIRIVSLDMPLGDGEERRLEDVLSHPAMLSPEEEAMQSDRERKLHRALGRLSPREADILRLRYGLAGRQPLTLEEVGAQFGITRERVRQIEGRARSRLRGICQQGGLGSLNIAA